MGFRDDVVVRVRPEADGARIDVRSSSRYGTFDFGANAARIRSLMNEIEDAIARQKPERPPAPPPPAKKGAPGKKDRRSRVTPSGSGRRSPARPSVATTPRVDQILEMGENGKSGRLHEPRIEPDIDRAHDRRDVGLALGQPVQDRGLARLAVADVVLHEARRLAHRAAVAGQIDRPRSAARAFAATPCSRSSRRPAAPPPASTRP